MKCLLCSSNNTEKLHTIYDYPIVSGAVASKGTKPFAIGDMTINYCMDCGVCIANSPKEGKVRYDKEYFSSNMALSSGAIVDAKLHKFVKFIGQSGLPMNARVLEIGSYDGALMDIIRKRYSSDVYGCDPCDASDIAINKYGLKITKAYYSSSLYEKHFFDVIVARNVLEHMYNPYEFLIDVGRSIKIGGLLILELPDGEYRIINAIIGSIVPEHPFYYGEATLYNILQAAGYTNIKIISDMGGMKVRAINTHNVSSVFQKEPISSERKLAVLRNGIKRYEQRYHNIHNALNKQRYPIYIYGANTCTLELIVVGAICVDDIECILDDDPIKWGKVIVNYKIPIDMPSAVVKANEDDVVLVCSYYSQDKINIWLRENSPIQRVTLYPEVYSWIR